MPSFGHRQRLGSLFSKVVLTLSLAMLVATPAGGAEGRHIRFKRLSTAEGLSQGTVTAILQDRTGFLWFGTQDGLNRFDGIRFEVFKSDPSDPTSLSSSWVEALIEDEAGDIWIGIRGGGVNRWVRATGDFEHFGHDPSDPRSLASNLVRALLLDRDGDLWVGTEDSGLAQYDRATGDFVHFRHDPADPRSLSHDKVCALYEDSAGRIWIGTLGGGMNLFEPGEQGPATFRRFRHDPADPSSLNDDSVLAFLEDASGDFWVASHGGVARLDRENGRFERFVHDPDDPDSLSGNRVRALLTDSAGRLWVGSDSGLNLFVPERGSFLHYRYDSADPESLSNDRVAALLEDRSGIFWVGTQGGGLNRWDPRTWSFANDPVRPSDLGSDDVGAISLDRDGQLWVGTFGGGLARINRLTREVTAFRKDPADPRSLSDDWVTALLHDSRNTLWVGTLAAGLNRFEPDVNGFTHFRHDPDRQDSLAADGVMSLFEDRDGQLWVGTLGGGLSLLDQASGRFRSWRHDPKDPDSVSDDRVTAIAQAPGGTLWLGTLNAGLNRFDPENESFLRLASDQGLSTSLSNNTVLSVHVGPKGRIWAGTQNGLNRLDTLDLATGEAAFRRFLRTEGLPSDFIYAVLSDDQGQVWVSTNRGISRFDPETETFRNYDTSDGLQGDEFNMNARFRAQDGELFFGGINGYNSFYPDRIITNTTVPPVVLTAFSRLHRPVRFERPVFDVRKIVLAHTDKVVSFEFAALDYTAPEKNRYRYKLEGFDPEWVEYGNRRHVTFTNLDPGTYTLRVQGSNNDGVWNEEGLSVRLVIRPPFWLTWWFKLLLVIVTAGVLYRVHVARTLSIRQRLRELEGLLGEGGEDHVEDCLQGESTTPARMVEGAVGEKGQSSDGQEPTAVNRDHEPLSAADAVFATDMVRRVQAGDRQATVKQERGSVNMEIQSSSGGQMAVFWGQSYESYDAAIAAAVEAGRQALAGRTLEWLEVIEFRGGFSDGRLQYQTAVRIGYA